MYARSSRSILFGVIPNYRVFGLMFAPCESDWCSACSARRAQRSAIESSMARISGFVVDRIASRQWAAFCFQGVCMGQASLEEIIYPLRVPMGLGCKLVRDRSDCHNVRVAVSPELLQSQRRTGGRVV